MWANEILTFHLGRIASQFILHFNINDLIFDTSEREETEGGKYKRKGEVVGDFILPPTMREYLHEFLFGDLHCQAIYTYSLAGGLIADDGSCDGVGAPLEQQLSGPTMQRLREATEKLRLAPRKQRQGGQTPEGQEVNLPDSVADTFKLLGHILRQSYDDRGEVIPLRGNIRSGLQNNPTPPPK
jgi:hypothetical protein